MSRQQIIDDFIMDYRGKPSSEEMDHLWRWAETIRSDDMLKKILAPENYPDQAFRPRTGDLNRVRGQILGDAHKSRIEQEVDEEGGCFWCRGGIVSCIIDTAGWLSIGWSGYCTNCYRGEHYKKLGVPQCQSPALYIQDRAKKEDNDCHYAMMCITLETNDWPDKGGNVREKYEVGKR